MTKLARVNQIVSALLAILFSVRMMMDPEDGIELVLAFLGVVLVLAGIRQIVYYATMGKYMVCGKTILFKGIIIFDLGLFSFGLKALPTQYVMIYLLLTYVFNGTIDILRAAESKKVGAPQWRMKLIAGILCLSVSALCVINISSLKTMMDILCSGFIYSAVLRIVMAVRKTAIVSIA